MGTDHKGSTGQGEARSVQGGQDGVAHAEHQQLRPHSLSKRPTPQPPWPAVTRPEHISTRSATATQDTAARSEGRQDTRDGHRGGEAGGGRKTHHEGQLPGPTNEHLDQTHTGASDTGGEGQPRPSPELSHCHLSAQGRAGALQTNHRRPSGHRGRPRAEGLEPLTEGSTDLAGSPEASSHTPPQVLCASGRLRPGESWQRPQATHSGKTGDNLESSRGRPAESSGRPLRDEGIARPRPAVTVPSHIQSTACCICGRGAQARAGQLRQCPVRCQLMETSCQLC